MTYFMTDASTGITIPADRKEIDRRIVAMREMMEREGVDLLVVVSPSLGGFRHYFTGAGWAERNSEGGILLGRCGNVYSVRGAGMIAKGKEASVDHSREVTADRPLFENIVIEDGFHAEGICDLLGGGHRIGLVNASLVRADLKEFIEQNVPEVIWKDVTDACKTIMSRKSAKEISWMSKVCSMMDKIFHRAYTAVKPFVYERDIVNELRAAAYELGSGGQNYLDSAKIHLVSFPDSGAETEEPMTWPGRRISSGDRVNISMYCAGFGNYCGTLYRSFVIGKACRKTKDMWNVAKKAQEMAAKMARIGENLKNVAERVNSFLADRGYRKNCRIFLHGIGYTMDEQPKLYERSESRPLSGQETLVIEITVGSEGAGYVCCGDVYLVQEEGAVRLTSFPLELVEL